VAPRVPGPARKGPGGREAGAAVASLGARGRAAPGQRMTTIRLITDGDVTSEWVKEYQIGAVVPPFNVEAVAETLNRLLEKPKEQWNANFERLRPKLAWGLVVQPLYRYCLEGAYAPDRLNRLSVEPPGGEVEISRLSRAATIWRHEGFPALAYRGWRYLQWWMART